MASALVTDIKAAIAELQSVVNRCDQDGKISLDPADSMHIAIKALRLGRTTNPPLASGFEIVMTEYTATAVRLALDLRIFKSLAAQSPLTADQLAERVTRHAKVEVESHFIVRILRVITIYNLVTETAPQTYAANANTIAWGAPDGSLESLHRHFYDQYMGGVLGHSISYFAKNGYRFPSSPTEGPFQSFNNVPGTTSYDHWLTLPGVVENFNNFMQALETSHWYTWFAAAFQVRRHLSVAGKPEDGGEEMLLVDVGGGKGGLLHGLRSALDEAGVKGKLVLEERSAVIQDALKAAASSGHPDDTGMPGVQYVEHDFFSSQPRIARGSLYYYVHWILHNWDDAHCITILDNIAGAMTKGYSRLLINERVLLEMGNDLKSAGLDFHMAYAHSAKERTLREFTELVERSGLKVVGYHKAPDGGEDVVECMLA